MDKFKFNHSISSPSSSSPSPNLSSVTTTTTTTTSNYNNTTSNDSNNPIILNNNFLKKSKKSFLERNRKLIENLLPLQNFKPPVYRRCCILLSECAVYFIIYIFLIIFLQSHYPIWICGIISMVILYVFTTRTSKYKLVSLVYIVIQAILNFAFFFKYTSIYSISNSTSTSIELIFEISKHNFLFLINLILCLISITIFFPKFILCLVFTIILNISNIVIHLISIYSLNTHKYIVFQNLILPIAVSFLLLFYSYVLSIDNRDIEAKEKRFRNIFDTSSEGLVIHRNGLIIDANSTFEKIFQVKQSDLYMATIWEYLPELESFFQQNSNKNSINNYLQNSWNNIFSNNNNNNNNKQQPHSGNSTPRNYSSSNNNNNNNNNISNTQLFQQLQQQQQHNGIVNRVSRSNTGLSESGSSIFDDSDSVDFFSMRNLNKSPIVFDTIGITPCGSEFTAQVKIERKKENQVIHNRSKSSSKNHFDVMSIVDVSARKKLIIADQALRRAEELNQAKITFLTTVSHEVRTPINAILASVEILDGSQLDPTQRDFLSCIKDSADYLLDLITDILDFSKIEAGKFELERIEFNILTMLEESLNIVYRPAQERGIDVLTFIDPDVPIILIGDPYRVKQCLLNFLSNAIKFTQKGQVMIKVSIELESPSANGKLNSRDYKLLFSVEDSGVGIKSELLDCLFTPFHQLGGSPRKYLGTGLGLSISKKLTALMGGEISVKSVYGIGSTFSFTSILQTSSQPITLKSLGYQLAGSLNKLLINKSSNLTSTLPKFNGFIYDSNIQTSNSLSNFLNLLDINLKTINPPDQDNLRIEFDSFLKDFENIDGNGNSENYQNINLIITNKLNDDTLLYFKDRLNSINNGDNNSIIYWFLLTDNGLQSIDSFYSGVIKKPCNLSNLVETIFKIFNCQIPIELYQLLTNCTKDDYKTYCKQRREPFKKYFNNSNTISNNKQSQVVPLNQSSPSSTSPLSTLNQIPILPPLDISGVSVKSSKHNILRKSSNGFYSDHVAITRGMVQVNRSPRPSTPPPLFNIKSSAGINNNSTTNGNNKNELPELPEPLNISEPITDSCDGGGSGGESGVNSSGSFATNNHLLYISNNNSSGPLSPSSGTASPSIIHTNTTNIVDRDELNQSTSAVPAPVSKQTTPRIATTTNNSLKILSKNEDCIVDFDSIYDKQTSTTETITTPQLKPIAQAKANILIPPINNINLTNSYDYGSNSCSVNNTPPITPHRRNCLIVDDTELNRKVLAQLLKKIDWAVSFAENGREALKEITSERCYDIIFMDCQMPIMDGFQTTKAIRLRENENDWKPINIVALSADSSSSFGQVCFDCGMNGYIGKPITLSTLNDTLSKFGGYRD